VEEHNKILDRFVGLKIRERRKFLGLTQAELADLLSLSHQQVQRYESGENTISMVRILKVAKALNVRPEYFYENAPVSEDFERGDAKGIIMKTNRPIKILIVEDTYSDELLFRKAVEASSVQANIHAIQNPKDVMDFLLNHKTGHDKELPDLIILDINMAHLNGLDLLKQIKGETKLKTIPVIMLTNSVRSKDMLEAYANSANGFVQKNSDLLEFFEDVDLILQYWSRTIILPSAA
jgi:two-component system, chemotaxis family, response regulator Rcp1